MIIKEIPENYYREEKVMKKKLVLGIAIACAALFAGGCSKGFNVFAPFTPSPGSLPATVANAANSYAAGDYAGAMAQYKAIADADPSNVEASYGYVKAYVKNAGFDIATFIKNGTGNSAPAALFSPAMKKGPILNDRFYPFGVNVLAMEGICNVIIQYLKPIADGTYTGSIPSNDVGLNTTLAFAYLLQGVFTICDPGLDGSLDYNFYDSNGTIKVVFWGTENEPTSGTFNTVKQTAKDALDNSIKYLRVANTTSGGGTIWVDVEKFLSDIRTQLNTI